MTVGAWNTRGMGATHGRFDPYLKIKHMATLWEKRGWDAALLSDVRFGVGGTIEVEGGSKKWIIVYRGRVAIALSDNWATRWLDSGNTACLDGKGAHCRGMMLNIPTRWNKGVSLMAVYANFDLLRRGGGRSI
jgi:hypothetical protein